MRKDHKYNRQTWNRKQFVKSKHHPVWIKDLLNMMYGEQQDDPDEALSEWYEEQCMEEIYG